MGAAAEVAGDPFVYILFFAAMVFLILHVFPPIVREIEDLGKSLPAYVNDFEHWAEHNQQFKDLNDKYGLTKKRPGLGRCPRSWARGPASSAR